MGTRLQFYQFTGLEPISSLRKYVSESLVELYELQNIINQKHLLDILLDLPLQSLHSSLDHVLQEVPFQHWRSPWQHRDLSKFTYKFITVLLVRSPYIHLFILHTRYRHKLLWRKTKQIQKVYSSGNMMR